MAPATLGLVRKLERARRDRDLLRARAERTMRYAADAARLDDGGLPVDGTPMNPELGTPRGWSGVRYNVAKDARLPFKRAPGYLSMMARVAEAFAKEEERRAEQRAPELGPSVQVFVGPGGSAYVYPRQTVKEE